MDDDLTARISQILGDPTSMEKLRKLADMFGSGSGQPTQNTAPQQSQPQQSQPQQAPARSQAQTASPARQGEAAIDPDLMKSMMKLAPIFSNLHREDESTRLLRALRPFLSEPRRKKLDEAIRLMQLVRMMPVLKGSGLFQ